MKKPHPDDDNCCDIDDGINFRNLWKYVNELEKYIIFLEEKKPNK